MGFGKMLSGLFRKDEPETIEKTQSTESTESDKSNMDMTDAQIAGPVESKVGSSDNVGEHNTSVNEATTEDKLGGTRENDGGGRVTEEKVLEVLSQVYDPEIPIDIVNLGLIYGVEIEDGKVLIRMTMTAPGCPASTQIAGESKILVQEIPGVESCDIDLVWDPPWDPSKMSEEAQESLGIF